MIEAPSFFILYEFLSRWLSAIDTSLFGSYAALVWFGVFLLTWSFSALLKHSPEKETRILIVPIMIAGISAFILFSVSLFSLAHSSFEIWAYARFGWPASTTYTYLMLTILGSIAIFSFIASRFASKEPRIDATLNLRQVFLSYTFFSFLVFAGVILWNLAHEAFVAFIIGGLVLVEIISILYWFYDIFIYLASRLCTPKSKAPLKATPGRMNRFAIVICAHNEALMIEHLIDSLYNMHYPLENYDIYVTCDNCRDDTQRVAEERGAIALVRDDLTKRGKNEALRWVIGVLKEKQHEGIGYDAYIVLNADNLVHENYLSEINIHLNQGHEIMQTYFDSKNPYDSWISECSSMSFWLSNRNAQEARSRLGLSAKMRGLGFVLRPSILEKIPWEAESVTEELIYTCKYLLENNTACHWVHSAKFYDERAVTMKASFKQRTRWMQGHIRTAFEFVPKLMVSGVKNFSWKQIDMALFLLKPLAFISIFVVYAFRLAFALAFPGGIAAQTYLMTLPVAAILAVLWLSLHAYTLIKEKRVRSILMLPLYYFFTCLWVVPVFRGFVKRNERFWVYIFHTRDLTIEDISEDVFFNDARERLDGLNNLHKLPLGQILLKAAIINGNQLESALNIQERYGGFLGNILIDMGAITEETLATYVSIQQVMRESAQFDQLQLNTLQLGQILVDAHLITDKQLAEALEHQRKHNCKIGESIVALNMLPRDVLIMFLEIQSLIGKNYLDEEKAHALIHSIADLDSLEHKTLETLLLGSGLVSKRQLAVANKHRAAHNEGLVESLLYLGYISSDTIVTIRNVVSESQKPKNRFSAS